MNGASDRQARRPLFLSIVLTHPAPQVLCQAGSLPPPFPWHRLSRSYFEQLSWKGEILIQAKTKITHSFSCPDLLGTYLLSGLQRPPQHQAPAAKLTPQCADSREAQSHCGDTEKRTVIRSELSVLISEQLESTPS